MLRHGFIRLADAYAGAARRRREGAPDGVLIVTAGGLGDTVLFALVLSRFVHLARAGEPVSVLVRADAANMTFTFPSDVNVESVDFDRLRKDLRYRIETLDRLYQANYRLVVSADYLRHPDLDEALIRACRASETVAMLARPWPKYDRRLGRNAARYDRQFNSGPPRQDKVLRWCAFADWLGAAAEPPPKVRLADDRLPSPAALVEPTVVIQPFSAVREKQSPPDLYRRLIGAVPSGHRVLITGTGGDLGRNPEYLPLLDEPGVAFDDSNFEGLVPTLRAARLVISVDTALMHLAVAVGAPTLCLASAAFVGEIVPYAPEIAPDNVEVFYHSMPCEGCLGTCVLPAEDGMYPCVARLDHDRVLGKVRSMLEAGR